MDRWSPACHSWSAPLRPYPASSSCRSCNLPLRRSCSTSCGPQTLPPLLNRRCSRNFVRCLGPALTSGHSMSSAYRRRDRASTGSPSAESEMSASATSDRVSVVIATYNMGRYLPQAVRSVLEQSYPNVEVQIIDDGSSDDTAEVVQQWGEDVRVRVHRQANAGQARAKNEGIARTTGPFVAFLDADDTWLPGKLTRQMPLFADRPQVGVVYSDYVRMDEEGLPLPKGATR